MPSPDAEKRRRYAREYYHRHRAEQLARAAAYRAEATTTSSTATEGKIA